MNFGIDMRNLEARIKRGKLEDQQKINLALLDYIQQLYKMHKVLAEMTGDVLKHDEEVISTNQEWASVVNRLMLDIQELKGNNDE